MHIVKAALEIMLVKLVSWKKTLSTLLVSKILTLAIVTLTGKVQHLQGPLL